MNSFSFFCGWKKQNTYRNLSTRKQFRSEYFSPTQHFTFFSAVLLDVQKAKKNWYRIQFPIMRCWRVNRTWWLECDGVEFHSQKKMWIKSRLFEGILSNIRQEFSPKVLAHAESCYEAKSLKGVWGGFLFCFNIFCSSFSLHPQLRLFILVSFVLVSLSCVLAENVWRWKALKNRKSHN